MKRCLYVYDIYLNALFIWNQQKQRFWINQQNHQILVMLIRLFDFFGSKDCFQIYFVFQSFDYKCTLWRLIQTGDVYTKLDIYVLIGKYVWSVSNVKLLNNENYTMQEHCER